VRGHDACALAARLGMANSIAHHIAVDSGDIVGIIGAGGKTTLMFELAHNLSVARRVLITTTTKIYRPTPSLSCSVVVSATVDEALPLLVAAWQGSNIVVLAQGEDAEGKLLGIPLSWVAILTAAFPDGTILVEADGAAGRLLKGHAPHEPVLPPETTIVVAMMGLGVIGKPLGSAYVHRPEIVAECGQTALLELVTPAIAAETVIRMLKVAKAQARNARLVLWLNNTGPNGEKDVRLYAGRVVCRYLLRALPDVKCIIGEVLAREPVQEVWPNEGLVAGVILAAGLSTRLRGEKLLLPWRGRSIAWHAAHNQLSSKSGSIAVVVGHRAEEIKQALGALPIDFVLNEDYKAGLGTSVRAAANHLRDAALKNIKGVLFALGDQPEISPSVIDSLLDAFFSNPERIVFPCYDGRRGNPVIFPVSLLPEFWSLPDDAGGRIVIMRHKDRWLPVPVDEEAVLIDIDAPADYEELLQR